MSEEEDYFDRLDRNLVLLGKLAAYQDANRGGLLICHSIIALWVSFWWSVPSEYSFYIFTFGPPAIAIEFANESLLASVGFTGGFFLIIGMLLNRNIRWEFVGMLMIMSWDVMMAFTFLQAGSYAVLVYGILGVMMWIHSKTAYRLLTVRA